MTNKILKNLLICGILFLASNHSWGEGNPKSLSFGSSYMKNSQGLIPINVSTIWNKRKEKLKEFQMQTENISVQIDNSNGGLKTERCLVDLQNELIDFQNCIKLNESVMMSRDTGLDSNQVERMAKDIMEESIKTLSENISNIRFQNSKKMWEKIWSSLKQIMAETNVEGYDSIEVDHKLQNIHDSTMELLIQIFISARDLKSRDRFSQGVVALGAYWAQILDKEMQKLKKKNDQNMKKPSSWEVSISAAAAA